MLQVPTIIAQSEIVTRRRRTKAFDPAQRPFLHFASFAQPVSVCHAHVIQIFLAVKLDLI